jgi:hypothetical protein
VVNFFPAGLIRSDLDRIDIIIRIRIHPASGIQYLGSSIHSVYYSLLQLSWNDPTKTGGAISIAWYD